MAASRRRTLPTPDELATWRAYFETFDRVRSRIEARLHADSQLSTGDYRVLLELSEAAENTLRSSTLAARIDWERSRLSGHLGRMERRGLIRRQPCADDARGTEVVLTGEGAEAFRASTVPHLQAIREVFVDALEPDQLASIDEVTAALRRHLGPPTG
jgi:DNA-binding MarR family transcriptional regulator